MSSFVLYLNTILVCTRLFNLLLYKHLYPFYCAIIRVESVGFDCWPLFAALSRIFPLWTKADKTSIYFHRIFLDIFCCIKDKNFACLLNCIFWITVKNSSCKQKRLSFLDPPTIHFSIIVDVLNEWPLLLIIQ